MGFGFINGGRGDRLIAVGTENGCPENQVVLAVVQQQHPDWFPAFGLARVHVVVTHAEADSERA